MESNFYSENPRFVFGFHGCERIVRDQVLNSSSEHLKAKNNSYDWLGYGVYFWLNDPIRALEWAKHQNKKEPAVIGAIIDLGDCLNLCERSAIRQLQMSYQLLSSELESQGLELKQNTAPDEGGFKLLRYRDCAVIERLHSLLKEESEKTKNNMQYDTVYGYFQEGADAYPGAGMKEKTHIQICVRNTNCIKGYFLPREIE